MTGVTLHSHPYKGAVCVGALVGHDTASLLLLPMTPNVAALVEDLGLTIHGSELVEDSGFRIHGFKIHGFPLLFFFFR